MNNRNLEYDQAEEEDMVKAERSKTGPYPASEIDKRFVDGLIAQGMSKEDAEQYLAETVARMDSKR